MSVTNPRAAANPTLIPLNVHLGSLRIAAVDPTRVSGATHSFYRYPARFSPGFAAAAIEAFSSPGDVVLDPFMGGGTTIVESMRMGRRSIGSDINALAVFVARVKTTPLDGGQLRAVKQWTDETVPQLRFTDKLVGTALREGDARLRNLHIPRARPIKKLIALAIEALPDVSDAAARRFLRCALLSTGQWALNGRRESASCEAFRKNLQARVHRMLLDATAFSAHMKTTVAHSPELVQCPIEQIDNALPFGEGVKADLVVTSPPYPGIHMLYHRWQIDGRKESPAPYWITQTKDGQGTAYYNLGGRNDASSSDYFENLRVGLQALRRTMKDGGRVVQMIAFARPRRDLPRYLLAMSESGFGELRGSCLASGGAARRIWRGVPNRAWHASSKGSTASSREVVLVHEAR